MNICIRVDSSTVIGTGHVARCLTLAGQFSGESNEISFICRELPGNIIEQILLAGYEVHKLPKANYDGLNLEKTEGHQAWLAVNWTIDAQQTKDVLESLDESIDLLVMDHYALDIRWEKEIKESCGKLMVIDDLADRKHICDLLLDQNYYKDLKSRYDNLVPDSCLKMLGPSYALLRPEFYKAQKNLRQRDGKIRRVFVFFGGSDASNQTKKILDAINGLKNNINYDIVIGSSNPFLQEINKICSGFENVTMHYQIDYMAELMAKSDLAIGGGGTTTWERLSVGLPSIIISVADNQDEISKGADSLGTALYLGKAEEVSPSTIKNTIIHLLENPAKIKEMSGRALSCDVGQNVSQLINAVLGIETKKLSL